MLSASEIRNRLADALFYGRMEEFEDWFVRESWNVHQFGDLELQKLVYALELRLAEYSTGHLDESALHRELIPLLERGSLNIGAPAPSVLIQTGSSQTTLIAPVWHTQPVDKSRGVVFA